MDRSSLRSAPPTPPVYQTPETVPPRPDAPCYHRLIPDCCFDGQGGHDHDLDVVEKIIGATQHGVLTELVKFCSCCQREM